MVKAHGRGVGESAEDNIVCGTLRGASEGVRKALELRGMYVSDKPWYVRTGGRSSPVRTGSDAVKPDTAECDKCNSVMTESDQRSTYFLPPRT